MADMQDPDQVGKAELDQSFANPQTTYSARSSRKLDLFPSGSLELNIDKGRLFLKDG